ncbi:MAG: 50S ribosomal protein L15 [Calditrichaeota bacterium]|nr:50S ribosomal protein L15 [Calditrichota bacterium]
MHLGNLKPAPGSVKGDKRIGRGRGSGHGDRATKGNKGAQSRSGYKRRARFEGGQMPLQRRLPKRGFNVPDRTEYREVKLGDLARVGGTEITPESLRKAGLVNGRGPVVVLGSVGAEAPRSLAVSLHRITASARAAIEGAGGSVTILPLEAEDRRVKKGPAKPRNARPAA